MPKEPRLDSFKQEFFWKNLQYFFLELFWSYHFMVVEFISDEQNQINFGGLI